jgi:type VI secretion system secreted protein Hcp
MSDFSFIKKVDKSSPVLLKRCAIGEPIKSVTLTARKAGKDQQEFLKYIFSNCFVTSYQISDAKGGDSSPTESLTFGFEKIEMAYSPQKPDGSLGGEVKAGYDQSINKAS